MKKLKQPAMGPNLAQRRDACVVELRVGRVRMTMDRLVPIGLSGKEGEHSRGEIGVGQIFFARQAPHVEARPSGAGPESKTSSKAISGDPPRVLMYFMFDPFLFGSTPQAQTSLHGVQAQIDDDEHDGQRKPSQSILQMVVGNIEERRYRFGPADNMGRRFENERARQSNADGFGDGGAVALIKRPRL